ncbi:hypothetical protein [Candidatus Laterigemmans baculatus]|uniref:hypothetical protein n=1 Tax=Candidatus Laterigemmans baculatus TaxID=2770505 RepID=UPI0013DCBC9F|nr:hypothetical protein [Candidatus Laterigemmans baculatus]
MITIPHSLARRLRIVFSRTLGIAPRSHTPSVQFRAGDGGVTIAIVGHDAAVAYQHSTASGSESFAVPFELLKRCEGTKHELVTLEREGDEIVARWTDAGIPQIARFQITDNDEPLPLPKTMLANDADALLSALREAVETTDSESSRYVLNCIRLRGSDGQIAGTDGRQLFVQDGFHFPWDDERLVPACRVFGCPDLETGGPLEIGSTDDWVVLRRGPWTIHLRIEKAGRYPRVDDCIPQPSRTQSTLRLSVSDASFLKRALRRIPSSDELNSPVTVELNGSVAIRAKSSDQPAPTEVVLTGSRREGEALRFNTNRDFLARAVRMGFRDVEFAGAESPACCRDARRVYVWSLLSKEGAILADPAAVRIESPAESARPVSPTRQQNSRRFSAVTPAVTSRAAAEHEAASLTRVTEHVEALEESLRELLRRTTALAQDLKRRPSTSHLPSAVGSTERLQDQAAA